METSDEDFLWTDASSDSSKETNVEMNQNKSNQGSNIEDGHNSELHNESEVVLDEPKQRKKKKLTKHNIKEEVENDNTNYQVDRSIKSEPNSDFDIPKRKKKSQHDESISSNHDRSLYDGEDYLNLRVKQEQTTFVELTPVKTKKKKNRKEEPKERENEQVKFSMLSKNKIDIEENNIDSSSMFNGDYSDVRETDIEHRKKKKKRKKQSVDDNTNDTLEESENSNKIIKKIKSKELLQNDASISYQLDIGNTEIVSSTLIENSFQENVIEQKNSRQNDTKVVSTTESTNCKAESIEKPLNKSRISDRLKFEEDSVDYEPQEDKHKHISKQLQQFLNLNSNLKPLQVDLHSDPEISDDDDVWILKGPHDISIKDLENINLTVDGKKKVKINENTYDPIIDPTITSAALLLFNKKKIFFKNMPLKGAICLRKRVPKVHIPYESLMIDNESSFIPLPETKCRHPLFGINYKNVARISAGIAKRLNSSEDLLGSKKKNKHRERLNSLMSMSASDAEVKPNVEELNSSKKRKGRKQKPEKEFDLEEKPDIEELYLKKKRKKMKLKHENDSDFKVKCSIEELYSSENMSKSKESQERESDKEEIFNDKVAKKKKKKSKDKIKTESDIETKPEIEVLHYKKKKRKHSDEKGESKKAKRARYDPSSAAAWESEQAIEENLFDF